VRKEPAKAEKVTNDEKEKSESRSLLAGVKGGANVGVAHRLSQNDNVIEKEASLAELLGRVAAFEKGGRTKKKCPLRQIRCDRIPVKEERLVSVRPGNR